MIEVLTENSTFPFYSRVSYPWGLPGISLLLRPNHLPVKIEVVTILDITVDLIEWAAFPVSHYLSITSLSFNHHLECPKCVRSPKRQRAAKNLGRCILVQALIKNFFMKLI